MLVSAAAPRNPQPIPRNFPGNFPPLRTERGGFRMNGARMTTPATQTRYPWRTVVRTAFQAVIGFAPLVPLIVDASGAKASALAGAAVAISSGIARVMALPGVEAWLQRFVPWLAAKPAEPALTIQQHTYNPVTEYQGKHEAPEGAYRSYDSSGTSSDPKSDAAHHDGTTNA